MNDANKRGAEWQAETLPETKRGRASSEAWRRREGGRQAGKGRAGWGRVRAGSGQDGDGRGPGPSSPRVGYSRVVGQVGSARLGYVGDSGGGSVSELSELGLRRV